MCPFLWSNLARQSETTGRSSEHLFREYRPYYI